jgi:hypothetical protein
MIEQFRAQLKLKLVKNRKKFYASMPPSPEQYDVAAANLALSYVQIRRCGDCSWPTISGYCCTYCGSSDPTAKQRAAR